MSFVSIGKRLQRRKTITHLTDDNNNSNYYYYNSNNTTKD